MTWQETKKEREKDDERGKLLLFAQFQNWTGERKERSNSRCCPLNQIEICRERGERERGEREERPECVRVQFKLEIGVN